MNKKIIRISVIVVLLVLVIMVFVSNTIYTMLLPEVKVTDVKNQIIDVPIETKGRIDYTNVKTVYSMIDGKVNTVDTLKDNIIKKGDSILSVDKQDIENERKAQEIDLKIMNENVKNLSGSLKEKALNDYNILNKKYKEFKEEVPVDGVYKADNKGTVLNMFVYNDDIITKNQKLYSITTKDSEQVIKFTLSYEAGLMVDETTEIEIGYYSIDQYGMLTKDKQMGKYYSKSFDTEEQRWTILVKVDGIVKKEAAIDNRLCDVSITLNSETYDKVVPTSAVFSDPQTGRKFVYIVEEKKGIFGGVNVLRSVNVEVVKENSLYTAIIAEEIMWGISKILVSSDKPVSEGAECYLKE